ncbi:hypothetical protein [Flavobacterium branchiophilum]|uniref:hypothetical protein n=1 Tax=Flavobacterium branchiophilum TaxID=55197 RepID=UPI0005C578F5|nr:hypothetical protein [Flavobacterium branchiophilum]
MPETKKLFTFAPRKRAIKNLKSRQKRFKNKSKKVCQRQKRLLLLHPLREGRKIRRNVHRHIELTAVLTAMLKHKKKRVSV